MLRRFVSFCLFLWGVHHAPLALSGQAYMERFNTFRAWYQQLPSVLSPAFLAFVQESKPLSNKLRDKWLYELARTQDWSRYQTYYQPSQDMNLVCYYHMARYHADPKALSAVIPLWLSAQSQAKPCNALFDALLHSEDFDQKLITKRIVLALEKSNLALARYLLKQYKGSSLKERDILMDIHHNPMHINQLTKSPLHASFYLYGLKRLFALNKDKALVFWKQSEHHEWLSEAKKQSFFATTALYKAIKNHEDASVWFAKIKPQYFTEVLRDWQIRFALKNND